jgi:hypothetical protein
VYDVMARIPPGVKISTAEEYGIPTELMGRFYEEKGAAKFTPAEKMRLMAGVLEMAQKYEVPTPTMTAEWAEISRRQKVMEAEARKRWPEIDSVSDGYYAAKAQGGDKDYLEQHPELIAYWDWRDAYKENDPVLMMYHPNPRKDAISAIWDVYMARDSAGKRQIKEALGRSFGSFLNKNYNAVRDEELFTWVALLTGENLSPS